MIRAIAVPSWATARRRAWESWKTIGADVLVVVVLLLAVLAALAVLSRLLMLLALLVLAGLLVLTMLDVLLRQASGTEARCRSRSQPR